MGASAKREALIYEGKRVAYLFGTNGTGDMLDAQSRAILA